MKNLTNKLFFIWLLALTFSGYLWINYPTKLVIMAGPEAGFFYVSALKLKSALERHGFTVEVKHRDDTLAIIKDVSSPDSGVDIGFSAQKINDSDLYETVSLGSIISEPFLIFYNKESQIDDNISSLKGKRIEVGTIGGGTFAIAEQVLAAYGITKDNSTFMHNSIQEAKSSFLTKNCDAIALLLPPSTPITNELGNNTKVGLIQLPKIDSLIKIIGIGEKRKLLAGSFNLELVLPSQDTDLLSIPVSIIVKPDLKSGAIYSLLEAMRLKFSSGTIFSETGEYPVYIDRQIPLDYRVNEYLKSGLPWAYRIMPYKLAQALDSILLFSTIIFFIGGVYKIFFPDVYSFTKHLRQNNKK